MLQPSMWQLLWYDSRFKLAQLLSSEELLLVHRLHPSSTLASQCHR